MQVDLIWNLRLFAEAAARRLYKDKLDNLHQGQSPLMH